MHTIEDIKKLISPIAEDYGVERVYLFGSYARGDATESSDVDIRIDSGNIKTLFKLGGFRSDLEEALKTQVDIADEGISEHFYNQIKVDEVVIYG